MERCIAEHWTLSRKRLVLRGPVVEIVQVAEDLQVPIRDVVHVSGNNAVLGLWGESLDQYNDLTRRIQNGPGKPGRDTVSNLTSGHVSSKGEILV